MIPGLIILRVLFAACIVFIVGYVFGNFSKSKSLTTITKVAVILAIALFMWANIFRFGIRYRGNFNGKHNYGWRQLDTTTAK
jgi:hypothetical protein